MTYRRRHKFVSLADRAKTLELFRQLCSTGNLDENKEPETVNRETASNKISTIFPSSENTPGTHSK